MDKWKDYNKKKKEVADKGGYTKPGALASFEQSIKGPEVKKERFKKLKLMFGG